MWCDALGDLACFDPIRFVETGVGGEKNRWGRGRERERFPKTEEVRKNVKV